MFLSRLCSVVKLIPNHDCGECDRQALREVRVIPILLEQAPAAHSTVQHVEQHPPGSNSGGSWHGERYHDDLNSSMSEPVPTSSPSRRRLHRGHLRRGGCRHDLPNHGLRSAGTLTAGSHVDGKEQPETAGIGAEIRAAREAQGLTWYSLAKKASVPNPTTIRDIEYGRDAKLSNVQAIAAALGLKLELVQQGG